MSELIGIAEISQALNLSHDYVRDRLVKEIADARAQFICLERALDLAPDVARMMRKIDQMDELERALRSE